MTDHAFGDLAATVPRLPPVVKPIHSTDLIEEGKEFDFEAAAECRACGARIVVAAQIEDGEIYAMSTGGLKGCQDPDCGDKYPIRVFEYWPILYVVEP